MTVSEKRDTIISSDIDNSVDIAVQRTNDDSVVSKRSAVYHGYFEDSYLRFFVRKLSRRSPLINRGYYLRMLVITDVIKRCIHHFQNITVNLNKGPIQVISLGAGYDTLAMRLKGETNYNNVHFYEVDFPSVMKSKSKLIQTASKGSFPEDIIAQPENYLVQLHGINYHAIGVDLRETEKSFIDYLTKATSSFSTSNPTIIFAECVMQYMPPSSAAELIKKISNSFQHAIFIAYDQINPWDSFGEVMQNSLRAKGSPLISLSTTPNGKAMINRAISQGMKEARFANFHNLSRYYLIGEELERVKALESFDEYEEWCEMCEHYGITMASTSKEIGMPLHPSFLEINEENENDIKKTKQFIEEKKEEKIKVHIDKWPTGRYGFEGWGNGEAFVEKTLCGDIFIISFGGFSAMKSHQRTNSVFVHSLRDGECKVTLAPTGITPPALIFHSLTRISRGVYIVLGGRTNPQNVTMDAYMLKIDIPDQSQQNNSQKPHVVVVWSKLLQIGDNDKNGLLPEARYRHAAVAVTNENEDKKISENKQIFIFGGCNAKGSLLGDAWLATLNGDSLYWKNLKISGDIPPASSSSAIIYINSTNSVLITGGIIMDGEVCEGSGWRIELNTNISYKINSIMSPRFSHTMCHVKVNNKERILILGGSSHLPRYPPYNNNNNNKQETAILLDAETGEIVNTVKLPSECPTWTRHSCIELSPGVIAVLGGGFTCFSFGTFTSKPLLLHFGDTNHWHVPTREQTTLKISNFVSGGNTQRLLMISLKERAGVETLIFSEEVFLQLMKQPTKPVLFSKINMGKCVEAWADPVYLKEAEGNTIVSVHVARETYLLDFVKKNFAFQHVRFSEIVDHCVAAAEREVIKNKIKENKESESTEKETWYLRAVASNMKTERSNIWKDFKGLCNDFTLPSCVMKYIEPRMHQAVLRLSAPPLQLWTHYDTLDNVLCQVVGKKRVVLFPPSEYNNLYITGSSSAVLNIDAPDLTRFPRFADACRNAIEVILEPGDMLFIPSLWFHHITTVGETHCISVNVFFERFHHDDYDKKDLYGNKDLPAAVRLRKRIVEAVQNIISDSETKRLSDATPLSSDFVEFALRQAIQDLEEIGDIISAARRGME